LQAANPCQQSKSSFIVKTYFARFAGRINCLRSSICCFLGAPLEFFIVMVIASLVGWLYSAPPVRLVSRGIGELVVAFVTGFAIPGLGYLAIKGQFDPVFVCFALPFTMYGLILALVFMLLTWRQTEREGKEILSSV